MSLYYRDFNCPFLSRFRICINIVMRKHLWYILISSYSGWNIKTWRACLGWPRLEKSYHPCVMMLISHQHPGFLCMLQELTLNFTISGPIWTKFYMFCCFEVRAYGVLWNLCSKNISELSYLPKDFWLELKKEIFCSLFELNRAKQNL